MTSKHVWIDDSAAQHARHEIGGKAANLVRLRQAGQPVPPFYVVSVTAFQAAVAAQQPAGQGRKLFERLLQSRDDAEFEVAAELRCIIRQLELPCDVQDAVRFAHGKQFGQLVAVAVRSSAVCEDSTRHSFAGMYESVLDVRGIEAVLDAIREVWASCFSDRQVAYRRRHRLPLNAIDVAVVVQQMIEARHSGVMFTCNPTTGQQDEIVIDVVPGNGHKLVRGEADPETFCIRKTFVDPIQRSTGRAAGQMSLGAHEQDAFTEAQKARTAEAGLAIERLFAAPQDVEFCFDQNGEFFVLQARPVTAAPASQPPRDNHQVWDNSNIIESYAGVTTPLTFSFIRRAYGIVYRCFAEVMGISPQVVRTHGATFDNMLGLFRGRVYYNLKNWYRLVRLFPGYQYNRGFMETMMGLREPLLLEDAAPPAGALRRWFVELPALMRLFAGIAWKFARIQSTVQQFQQHFDAHYDEWRRIDFRRCEPHELLAHYRRMEDALLWNWRAPIINDFFVMVTYGLLKKLCAQWCDDSTGSLHNGLLCATGNLESAKPAWRMLELAQEASADPPLRDLILHEPAVNLPQRVAGDSRFTSFQANIDRYLDEYGLRCADELKLEALSYRDHPEQLYEIIRGYLQMDPIAVMDVASHERRERSQRDAAEAAVYAALARRRGWLPRAAIFRFVLKRARQGIRNRENLRFARTKIYGIARAMFRAVGARFARDGILEKPDDVFYLTTDEVWHYVEGTAVSTDLRGLAAIRRREYAAYSNGDTPPPANRFETCGLPYCENKLLSPDIQLDAPTPGMLQGIACCPGTIVGTTQWCDSPIAPGGVVGDILVAERTDPGWVTLFPAFRGILLERGSVLSHSAIVAREMGIPTIVGVAGLRDRLKTTHRVRMDGERGTVEIVEPMTRLHPIIGENRGEASSAKAARAAMR